MAVHALAPNLTGVTLGRIWTRTCCGSEVGIWMWREGGGSERMRVCIPDTDRHGRTADRSTLSSGH